MNDWSALKYVEEDEAWTTRILLPSLSKCSIKWSLDPDGIEPLDEEADEVDVMGGVEVELRTEEGARPSEAQRKAFEYLVAQGSMVGKSVLAYLSAETRDTYLAEAVPPEEEWSVEDRKTIRRLRTAAGFRELVELTGITILPEEKDGFAYVVFDFNTALDEEHGLSVIVHRDRPLNFAGSGEDGGGLPEDDEPGIDWTAMMSSFDEYHALLKSIKNVATATAALGRLPEVHAAYRRAANELEDLQHSAACSQALSTPQGTKAFRRYASIGGQYRRLAAKDDVVAVLDEPLAAESEWRRIVEIAKQFR